jgi:hypothetical protein
MLPETASPIGRLKRKFVPTPDTIFPVAFEPPAIVVTTPAVVTFRTLWHPASATKRLPDPAAPPSKTMLVMLQNVADVPAPLPLGHGFAATRPPPPASVLTTPTGETVRTDGNAGHASPTYTTPDIGSIAMADGEQSVPIPGGPSMWNMDPLPASVDTFQLDDAASDTSLVSPVPQRPGHEHTIGRA